MNATQGSGLTRRRQRLSDEETRRRMLEAGLDMINQAGLTVSLEHISFEDVIRDAGVARSAVYRRWPYKDLFFSELLRELAKGSAPDMTTPNPDAVDNVNRIIRQRMEWLKEPHRRTALVAEIVRQTALRELETFSSSPAWRTYIALNATFLGLPDGELRDEVQASLEESEQAQVTLLAGAYQELSELLGCRLRGDVTFRDVARLVGATMRGMVLLAPTSPDLASRTVDADPFGAGRATDWSAPALAMASIVLTFIEPDPEAHFDDERLAAVRKALTARSRAARRR